VAIGREEVCAGYDDRPWPKEWIKAAHSNLMRSSTMFGVVYRRQLRRAKAAEARVRQLEET
jgi:hypothetical protein